MTVVLAILLLVAMSINVLLFRAAYYWRAAFMAEREHRLAVKAYQVDLMENRERLTAPLYARTVKASERPN